DVVELQNLSSFPADVVGWFLTDDIDIPKKFRIPNGTIIGPGGFLRIQSFDLSSQSLIPFGFSSLGEQVFIFSGDLNTNLTGYLHGFKFGAQSEGVSFGRYVDSEKREHFVAQSSSTLGQTNAGPRIPAVVISEIMYHPPDIELNGSFWNDSEDEYIELANRRDQAVALFDPSALTNTWRLSGSVEYSFPANTYVPANGYLLVVSFDPVVNSTQAQAFKAKYGIGEEVTLVGPYSGHLDNDNGRVSLLFPDTAIQDGTTNGINGTPPYVLCRGSRVFGQFSVAIRSRRIWIFPDMPGSVSIRGRSGKLDRRSSEPRPSLSSDFKSGHRSATRCHNNNVRT
ncbi:MAG: hypothetical protein ABI651_13715, partial [Verrucomicrobiota bacterium]